MKRIDIYGDEKIFVIVGIHENKDQFIKEVQEFLTVEETENYKIDSECVYRGYLYGDIYSKNSCFSKKEKPENIKKYGKQSECFYIEEDDI